MSYYPDSRSPEDTVTHPVNVGYLVVGLVFLGIAAVWALQISGVLTAGTLGWLVPAVVMAAGSAGLLATVARGRARRRRETHRDPNEDTDLLEEYR